MSKYLFVHFKEKRTPDGEQVYFGISKDGFNWELVNDGQPILWSYRGDKGVRDFTVHRKKDGEIVILATDLSLAYGMPGKYHDNWGNIVRFGSKDLVMWSSRDLVNWSEQRMLHVADDDFGCVWAPDVFYDKKADDYIVHWSSTHRSNDFGPMGIYYARTRDFKCFSLPEVLLRVEGSSIIDSAMYEEDGKYYLFVKGTDNPAHARLFESTSPTGPFSEIKAFGEYIGSLESCNTYEAPTAFKTANGKWCLMLDFYGVRAEEQGYVPFLADKLEGGDFKRSDDVFSFPYGYKHGTVLEITDDEYERLRSFKRDPNVR